MGSPASIPGDPRRSGAGEDRSGSRRGWGVSGTLMRREHAHPCEARTLLRDPRDEARSPEDPAEVGGARDSSYHHLRRAAWARGGTNPWGALVLLAILVGIGTLWMGWRAVVYVALFAAFLLVVMLLHVTVLGWAVRSDRMKAKVRAREEPGLEERIERFEREHP